MIRYHIALAILIASVSFSSPATAQYGGTSSLTHVVSATIFPRVKTRVSPPTASSGLGLRVTATQSYVVSIKAVASETTAGPIVRWSSSAKGEFEPLTSADTVLVAGQRSSTVDTAVFFRDPRPAAGESTVYLTVSAP